MNTNSSFLIKFYIHNTYTTEKLITNLSVRFNLSFDLGAINITFSRSCFIFFNKTSLNHPVGNIILWDTGDNIASHI